MSETDDVHQTIVRGMREAGLDPDGPPRPPQPRSPLRPETRRKLRLANDMAIRDAMLRRALTFLW